MANTNTNESTVTTEPTVKIKIPVLPGIPAKEQGDEFVSVNDRNWVIQRGKVVEVPECVAEVLRNREIMLDTIMEFEAEYANQE